MMDGRAIHAFRQRQFLAAAPQSSGLRFGLGDHRIIGISQPLRQHIVQRLRPGQFHQAGPGVAAGQWRCEAQMGGDQINAIGRNQFEALNLSAGQLTQAGKQGKRALRPVHPGPGDSAMTRCRHQFQRHGGDEAQRAFSADQQLLDIKAGVVLGQALQLVQHAAIGQHGFQPRHQRPHGAVAQHLHAAGIGRGEPPHRR